MLPQGRNGAHIAFLSPADILEDSHGAEMLEAMARTGAEHGAHSLIAEVDEHSPAFECLRRFGFAIYSRQRIWGMASDAMPGALAGELPSEDGAALWRPAAAADELAISSLYLNLVPPLVQQVEPPPTRHGPDLVHWRQGELLGYLNFNGGPRGVWIQPYFHPGAEDPDRLLGAFLSNLEDRRQRPLYVCVRSYQSWMTAPLRALGFEALADQAVMVKRLVGQSAPAPTGRPSGAGRHAPQADGSLHPDRGRDHARNRRASMTVQQRITDNLDVMLSALPTAIVQRLTEIDRFDELMEVILDVGRVPTARYVDGESMLLEREVAREDIEFVVARIGEFDADNRAGIERTLHRISAIRNRHARIVGLTCRVGRAVYGTIDIIEDIVTSGKSVLLLGRPGVGKTTMLREAARILAETKRVVIVDTSNEIAGDGDVPHPAIGRARRMQVREPVLQHEVMIEAVENHNPEVIVIDEIGRELEAVAARTIAERGVQLIGTAHGNIAREPAAQPDALRSGGRHRIGHPVRRGSPPAGDAEDRPRAARRTDVRRAGRDPGPLGAGRTPRRGVGRRCHAARAAAAAGGAQPG